MPTTYYQEHEIYEDGNGYTKIILSISDTHDGLFQSLSSATCYETGILEIGDESKNAEGVNSKLIESELKIVMDETTFGACKNGSTAIDIACRDFVLQSLDTAVTRYVALFYTYSDAADQNIAANISFKGVISPKIESQHINWDSEQYSSTTGSTKVHTIEARPYYATVIGQFTLEQLIDGDSDIGIPGLEKTAAGADDMTWANTHVQDRRGYYKEVLGSSYINSLRVHKLVNLNTVLRKLADNLEAAVNTLPNQSGFAITFNRSELNWKVHPARFYRPVLPAGAATSRSWEFPSFSDKKFMKPEDWNDHLFGQHDPYSPSVTPYNVYSDEAISLVIDPDETNLTIAHHKESIWIDYKTVITKDYTETVDGYNKILESNPSAARDFKWANRFENFTELMYAIAINLGLYVEIQYTDNNVLNVEFTANHEIAQPTIYLKDSTSAKQVIESIEGDQKRNYVGATSYLNYEYNKFQTDVYKQSMGSVDTDPAKLGDFDAVASYPTPPTFNENTTLFTLSPSCKMRAVSASRLWGWDDQNSPQLYNSLFAQNHFSSRDDGSTETDYLQEHCSAVSLTTAMFMFVDKRTGEVDSPDDYWVQAARISYKIIDLWGVEKEASYGSLSDWLQSNNTRSTHLLESTIDLEVPGLTCFSSSSTGSSPDWQLLKIGSQLVLDSVTYTVIGYTRNPKDIKTTIKLVASGLFEDILPPVTPNVKNTASDEMLSVGEMPVVSNPAIVKSYTAHGTIYAGNVVSLRSDGKVEVSLPNSDHYLRILGVSIETTTISDGESLNVQKSGILANTIYGASATDRLYLVPMASNSNLSTTKLTSGTGVVDKKIAECIASNSYDINIDNGWIFE